MNSTAYFVILISICVIPIQPILAQGAGEIPEFLLDLNGDGVIDSKDLLLLIRSWGLEGIATPTPTPVVTQTPTNANSFDVGLDLPPPFPLRMIRIPAGSFMMGSPDTERSRGTNEGPQHQVTIPEFFMGQTEVTQAQWKSVMGALPECDTEDEFGRGENHPVYCVTWIESQDFLLALNNLSDEGTFRLPTEAEWEYACRAGGTKRFYFGNSLGCEDEIPCSDCDADPVIREKRFPPESTGSPSEVEPNLPLPNDFKRSDFMWFCANSDNLSQPVRSLRANAFGLFDMAGNVDEWVQDEHHLDYTGAPTDGSAWIGGGNGRVWRGGSFISTARHCRSAYRIGADPTFKFTNTGLRVAWTP